MSVARAWSAALVGLEARPVVVEAALGLGLPGLTIVGLPDAAVRESRERIRSALRQIGLPLPGRSVVVNLAPADLPKSGNRTMSASVKLRTRNTPVATRTKYVMTLAKRERASSSFACCRRNGRQAKSNMDTSSIMKMPSL